MVRCVASVVLALSFSIIVGSASTSWAATDLITFGNTSRDIGNQGPTVEGAYQYNAVGNSWSIQPGGPPATIPFPTGHALVTFWGIAPAVGNTLTFTRLDGQDFFFTGLDLRGRLENQRNDVVLVTGFNNGSAVATQTLQSSTETWSHVLAASGFASPIDTLHLRVVESNGSTIIMDNFAFAQVPEPTTLAALPALALLACRRRG